MRPRDQERKSLTKSPDIDERSGNAGLQAAIGKRHLLSEGPDGAFNAPSGATTASPAPKIRSNPARRTSAAAASAR